MNVNEWNNQDTYVNARKYKCGFCGLNVAPLTGYGTKEHGHPQPRNPHGFIFSQMIALCPHCARPTFWDGNKQVPGAVFGEDVQHLPPDIGTLYADARNCMTINAYTSGAMACRQILMNVAVYLGAATSNQTFAQYVDYLNKNGHVPAQGKAWVDHIRKKGNEAAHEIPATAPSDLEDLLVFLATMLRIIFEFPKRLSPSAPPASGS